MVVKQQHPRVTLHDVAKAAGVSRSTASRALNGSPRISKRTTEHVRQIAQKLGFVANAQGRALAMGHSETIAILVTEPLDEFLSDPTYGTFLRGISEELSQSSYLPILMQASTQSERIRVQRHLERHIVDAVIDISPYIGTDLLDVMAKIHMPAVLCGQLGYNPYGGIFSNVYSDDVEGAALAARAMWERGRRNVLAIMGPAINPAVPDRLKGYRSVYGRDLPDERIIYTGWDESSGFNAINQLLDEGLTIDGVLAASDRIAVGVMAALSARDISVPDAVSVIGYDDHPLAAQSHPPLTTVHQPLMEEGRQAAELALASTTGAPPTTKILHMSLVRRASL
ncbi:LacI family transcriptional regulator [Bifidobacterium aemilianum]|uniref:LacI family transcriptional regulator n=1 Tax=Bifidobacterium aemilianum TaxID=2493120 RepID=A0A366K7F8_9BIFI|nr:LacI family DNA-binding transcriptional regulator [Bifidobacterium aemilianum]RBP97680.1 LacI family transcriptional regulator [Bifidobacterium aemilianum]